MIIPFFWMVSTSFKTYLESMQIPPSVFPEQLNLANYANVFESANFMTYYANTIFVTVMRTAAQLFLCSMAAYAFARLEFPFKNTLFILILSVLMVPIQVILIPNYALLSQFGWIDTFYALIVPGIFSAFGVFLLRQFLWAFQKNWMRRQSLMVAQSGASIGASSCRTPSLPLLHSEFLRCWLRGMILCGHSS